MLNHMRHVDKIVRLGLVCQKTADIAPDFGQLYGVWCPRFYVGFVFDAKIGTEEIYVSQPQGSCEEPAGTKTHIQNSGMFVPGQKITHFIPCLQYSGRVHY